MTARRYSRRLATALVVAVPAVLRAQQAARGAAAPPATLMVFITVDQMRADYLTRFGAQFTGGLARLMRGGAVFTHAAQDHANTATAPGHSVTLSGRFPRSTGILTNDLGVTDPASPLVGGGGAGASPFRFRGSTLMDWLRRRDPLSRGLSVSRKDRGAILPFGRGHEQVFWYASDGRFTTSRYYADTLPTWVNQLNARHVPQSMAGRAWRPLLPASTYPERDSVPQENGGRNFTFPHALAAEPARAARDLPAFPWMDQLTLDAALAGAQALRLGAGPHTDLLAVSLSTTDEIGHDFGPDSRELHDQILRLDRSLGAFLDSLYAMRDSARVIVALTADHGVAPLPELAAAHGRPPARRVRLAPLLRGVRASLERRGVPASAVDLQLGMLLVDRAKLAAVGLDTDSVVRSFVVAARTVPGVARVDLPRDLARADTSRDVVARRWTHAIPPDAPVEAVVTLDMYNVWGAGNSATHGTPWDYDTDVPIIFYGAPFVPGRYAEPARVADMAPTLARVTGVTPAERLDGRVLSEALRQPPAPATPQLAP